MDFIKPIFSSPFFWGFALGMVFLALALWAHFKTKLELKRYRRHLSDKLEIEAQHLAELKKDKETLKQENENLRLKTKGGTGGASNQNLERELEIYARAEKSMYVTAPGFSAAWETAKSAALEEVEQEEQGKSIPRKIFKKFFSTSSKGSSGHLLSTSEKSSNDTKSGNAAKTDS